MAALITSLLMLAAPVIYLLFFSPTKYGELVTCASEEAQIYTPATIEEILSDLENYENSAAHLSGKMIFYPVSGFYLSDGIFLIPLDFSLCQEMDVFKRSFSAWANIDGKVTITEGEPSLVIEDFSETAPGWVLEISSAGLITFIISFVAALVMRLRTKKEKLVRQVT